MKTQLFLLSPECRGNNTSFVVARRTAPIHRRAETTLWANADKTAADQHSLFSRWMLFRMHASFSTFAGYALRCFATRIYRDGGNILHLIADYYYYCFAERKRGRCFFNTQFSIPCAGSSSRSLAVGWICLSLYFFASFTDATKTNEIELSVHVLRWKYWQRFSLFICYRLFFFWQETEKRRESREKWHWHSQCHFSSAANRWI